MELHAGELGRLRAAARRDPVVREQLRRLQRRISSQSAESVRCSTTSVGSGSIPSSRASRASKDSIFAASTRVGPKLGVCAETSALAVPSDGRVSNRTKAYLTANRRHQRQVRSHAADSSAEPDPRRESAYQQMCRSGFLGTVSSRTQPDDVDVGRPPNRGTFDREDPNWIKWDGDKPTTQATEQGENSFKVGDTFAPHEHAAELKYVANLRRKLQDMDEVDNPYEQVNMVAPWKANTQDKAHWLRGRADGSLSPFSRIEGMK